MFSFEKGMLHDVFDKTQRITNNEIVNIESYGHFDIMDSVWADTFHKFVSEGSKDRSPYNIDKYHKYLSDKIIDYNDDEDF